MNKKGFFVMGFVVIFALVSFIAMSKSDDQSGEVKLRADEGELVWIILNHIKPDKREQFEEFVEIWNQTMKRLKKEKKMDSKSAQAIWQLRLLLPTEANEDGSYTYVFLADPWIEGVESRILPWFRKAYSEEEAQKYAQMFSDCFMHPQESYMSTQGKGLK
jgi:hypothetical protein